MTLRLPLPITLALGAVVLTLLVGGWYGAQTLRARPASQSSLTSAGQGGRAAAPVASEGPETFAQKLCTRRLAEYQAIRSPDTGQADAFAVSLLAAYPSSAADVAAEEERPRGPHYRSPLRDRDSTEPVAVCFFAADRADLPFRPEGDFPPVVRERMQEVVTSDGTAYGLDGGDEEELEPAPIPRSGGG